jgi:O-antigen ligase
VDIVQPTKYFKLLWLWIALNSIVLIEPSPCDILFVICLAAACIFSYMSFSDNIFLPLLLVVLFIEANLISLLFAAEDPLGASRFYLITFYLGVSWIFLIGLLQRYGGVILEYLFSGYMVAALIAAAVGITAYFHVIPYAETFLYFGRAMGPFKDANVYGPFLIPAVLYGLYRFERSHRWQQFLWLFAVVFLSIGVLLSFSRAAWGNYFICVFLYFLLPPWPSLKVRIKKGLILFLLLLPVLIFVLTHSDVSSLFTQRLGFQSYDHDRFGTQIASLHLAAEHPLGIGAGQTERVLDYSTHSLYIRVFTESGILGCFSFLSFILLTVLQSLRDNFRENRASPYAAIVTASLAGVLFNSFFIDTLHWRHFWFLLALPWVPWGGGKAVENRADCHPIR